MSSRYRLAYLPTTIHNPLHPYAMFLLNSTFFWFKSEQLALYSFLYTYLHVPLWQSLAFWIWIFVYLYPSCIYVPYIWGLNLDRNIHPVAVLKICLYILHSIYVVGPCWLIKPKQCYTSHCPQACEIWPIALTSVWSVWLIDRFNK